MYLGNSKQVYLLQLAWSRVPIPELDFFYSENAHTKVSMPNTVTYPTWAPIFEQWIIRCRSKNGHHKDLCENEIELHVENLLIVQVQQSTQLEGSMWSSYDFDDS